MLNVVSSSVIATVTGSASVSRPVGGVFVYTSLPVPLVGAVAVIELDSIKVVVVKSLVAEEPETGPFSRPSDGEEMGEGAF